MLKQKMPFKHLFLIFSLFFNSPLLCMENDGDYPMAVIVEGLDGEHESGNKDLLGEGILLEAEKRQPGCFQKIWRWATSDGTEEKRKEIEQRIARRKQATLKAVSELNKLEGALKSDERNKAQRQALINALVKKNGRLGNDLSLKAIKQTRGRRDLEDGQEADDLLAALEDGHTNEQEQDQLQALILEHFDIDLLQSPDDVQNMVDYLKEKYPAKYKKILHKVTAVSAKRSRPDQEETLQEKYEEKNIEIKLLKMMTEQMKAQTELQTELMVEQRKEAAVRLQQKEQELKVASANLKIQAGMLKDMIEGGDEDRMLVEEQIKMELQSKATARKRFALSTGITVTIALVGWGISAYQWATAPAEDQALCPCNDTMTMNMM